MTGAKRSCRYDDDRDGTCIRHPDGCPYEEPFDADALARERAFLAARDDGHTTDACRQKFDRVSTSRVVAPTFAELERSTMQALAALATDPAVARAERNLVARFTPGCLCGCNDGKRRSVRAPARSLPSELASEPRR